MAKSGHPSSQSRVATIPTAFLAVGQRLRQFLPARPHAKLPSRTPAPFHPAKPTLTLGHKDKAQDLLVGRFHFAGQLLDVGPWETAAPSRRFAAWLHEFDWLHDLLAVESPEHQAKARAYVDGWIDTFGKGNEFVSDPSRLSRRLFNWLALWSPALSVSGAEDSDMDLGGSHRLLDRRRTSVLRQLTILRSLIKDLPPGLPRITAGCALAIGGARITDRKPQFLERGLDLLDSELTLQILPDGGHITRSPETSAQALSQLLTLDTLLADRGLEGSRELSRAIDRLAPIVAFFRRPKIGRVRFGPQLRIRL